MNEDMSGSISRLVRDRVQAPVDAHRGIGTTLAHGSTTDFRGGHARRDARTRWALLGADMLSIELSLLVAAAVAGARPQVLQLAVYGLVMLPVWALVFKMYGLYDRDIKRISYGSVDDLPWVFHAVIVGTLLFWFYVKLAPPEQMPMSEVTWFAAVSLPTIIFMRSLVRRGIVAALGSERVLIAANGATCDLVARKLNSHPEYGQRPVVLLVPSGSPLPSRAAAIAELFTGGAPEIEGMIAAGSVDRVLIARDDYAGAEVVAMIDLCRRYGVKIGVVPGAADAFGPSLELDEVEGMTILGVNPPVLGRTTRTLKRCFDLVIAVPVLLLSAPVMAGAAIAVRLDSRGPVLYRQSRVGQGCRVFTLFKFRTMVDGAESQYEDLMKESLDPNWLDLEHDPRVTRVGSFLRRTSIDELPQLINVLRGEMSLVGPRPLTEVEDAAVLGRHRERLDLVPGITGLWQVLGRTSIPFEEMVKLDYIYVANWSIWMDIRLLLRTLPAVIRQRGVN